MEGNLILDRPQWRMEQNFGNEDHNLMDSVSMEKNDIFGFKVHYYVLDPTNSYGDYLFGEFKDRKFLGPYETYITYEPINDTHNLNQFGIFSEEDIQYMEIPIKTFNRDVTERNISATKTLNEPAPGDVIVTLWNDKKYEVTDVNNDVKIFAGYTYVYSLQLKPIRYSEDSEEMDALRNDNPLQTNEEDMLFQTLADLDDSDAIEAESNSIDNNDDADKKIYGY